MYAQATGWLGWPPSEAAIATFPDIRLAIDGKVDFLAATTPGGKRKERKPGKAALNTKLKAMFGLSKPKGAG